MNKIRNKGQLITGNIHVNKINPIRNIMDHIQISALIGLAIIVTFTIATLICTFVSDLKKGRQGRNLDRIWRDSGRN